MDTYRQHIKDMVNNSRLKKKLVITNGAGSYCIRFQSNQSYLFQEIRDYIEENGIVIRDLNLYDEIQDTTWVSTHSIDVKFNIRIEKSNKYFCINLFCDKEFEF
jgi:uncharacterized lipoprotein